MKILNKYKVKEIDKSKMVYIGRSSIEPIKNFGNPFSHIENSFATVIVKTRDEAIDNFEEWIRGNNFHDVEPEKRKWILKHLKDLVGKDLVCWCFPNRCHGEIYIKLLKERGLI